MKKSKCLNILMPTSCFFPGIGGAQIGFHNLAKKLQEIGHKPIMLVPYNSYKFIKKKGWNFSYKILPLPPKILGIYKKYNFLGLFYFKIYFFFLKFFIKYDLCHINLAYPLGTLLISCLKKKDFISVMCAGEDIQILKDINYGVRINKSVDKLIKKNLKKANKIIALNHGIFKTYKEVGIKKKNIITIPYGIEDFLIKKKYPKKKTINFLVVGRNHPKKNYSCIIKAAQNLIKMKIYNFKIIFVGKDVFLLKDLIKNCNLEKNVKLINQIGPNKDIKKFDKFPSDKLIKLYLKSDIFLFPSVIELCPVAILEAMTAGLPIITSNTPGCRDIVKKNKNAFLVNFKNLDKISFYMKKLIIDSELRKKMSRESIKYSKNFNLNFIAKKYENLFLSNLRND